MALPPTRAAQADAMLERTIRAAATSASLDSLSFDSALVLHFDYLREHYPLVYGLVLERLRETRNELLDYTGGGCDD